MQDLIELVDLIKKSKFKSSGLLGLVLEPNSQMERLFDAIAERDQQDWEEPLLALFPEYKNNMARLATLKSKLKDRLLDTVLLLDFGQSGYSDRQKAYDECHRRYATAMVLLEKGARRIGIDTLEALLRNTLRFEFTELSLNVLRNLSRHYAFVEGEKKKYEQIEVQLAEQSKIYEAEMTVERLYKDLINDFVRRKSSKGELLAKAAQYVAISKPLLQYHHTYWVQLLGRLMEITLHDSKGDHQRVATLAEEGIAFFQAKPYASKSAFQAFHNHLLEALFNLRDYERSIELVERYKDRFEEGTFNWFKLQELVFLQAMHTGRYEEAAELRCAVMKHPKYERQSPPIWELWKIFDAFLAYLVASKALSEDFCSETFKLGKFANEIQFYTQDKSGMNVPVLLIQFLFELLERRWDKSLDRIESLSKYRTRYLSDPTSSRSHTFIQMLEQIPKANFDMERVFLRTKTIQEKLKNTPAEINKQNYETEILPYEVLWEMVKLNLVQKEYVFK